MVCFEKETKLQTSAEEKVTKTEVLGFVAEETEVVAVIGRQIKSPNARKINREARMVTLPEKFFETDQKLGFQSDSYRNCGQSGHWEKEC